MKLRHLAYCVSALLISCTPSGDIGNEVNAMIDHILVDGQTVNPGKRAIDVSKDSPEITVFFSDPVDISRFDADKVYISGYAGTLSASAGDSGQTIVLKPSTAFDACRRYILTFEKGSNLGLKLFDTYRFNIVTAYDSTPKFPQISDDELLTLVQERTFKYFWDYAHPVSGLARERQGSGETVTIGGSGFGIMCLPVGVERGFITRAQAAERMRTIAHFLAYTADRFHGAFPHWLDGSTGKVIPFSSKDNGGDLVETAFMIQGLLTARAYFDRDDEADIRSLIDTIWVSVQWDWYLNGKDVLYWHWSPSDGWAMNMPIRGWNEGLIVYVLAASSPTHSIPASAYHNGWASGLGGGLPVNGPMFFAHYSFLGLDPRLLADKYADYWEHNVAHARYNYDYCVRNSAGHAGYSASSWGLTASDIPGGYAASAPSRDTGTIAPTAALASMPYLPSESLAALHTFYYIYGDRLWGEYGFKDAFNLDQAWFASSYLAIDQGPIVVMIENYRSGLLWDLFMKNTDIPAGLKKLGF